MSVAKYYGAPQVPDLLCLLAIDRSSGHAVLDQWNPEDPPNRGSIEWPGRNHSGNIGDHLYPRDLLSKCLQTCATHRHGLCKEQV